MFCRLPKKEINKNPSIQCHSDANFYNETFNLDPNGQQIFIMCESKTTIVPVTKLKVAGSESKVHYRRTQRVVRKKMTVIYSFKTNSETPHNNGQRCSTKTDGHH